MICYRELDRSNILNNLSVADNYEAQIEIIQQFISILTFHNAMTKMHS